MAKKYNIKIIAPLTDGYKWYNGSYGWFTARRGVNKADFWTNSQVRADFKEYIRRWLTHVNQYTGVMYKDEPALGMIELGNELGNIRYDHDSTTRPTIEWLTDISSFIKSIDSNHLVLDCCDEAYDHVASQNISTIDVHSTHFYGEDFGRLDRDIQKTHQAGKPYFIGEYSSNFGDNWFREIEKRNCGSVFWSMYNKDNRHYDGYTQYYSDSNSRPQLLKITNHHRRLLNIPEINQLPAWGSTG
jgi:mannan endo-1,4-beta-mannosidase